MKIRLIASLLLFVGMVACRATGPTAYNYVFQGTNDLVAQDIPDANTNFQAALALDPTNEAANFLIAATRMLVVMQSPAGSNFLTGLGFAAGGRSFYDWTAQPQTNSSGRPEFPKGYNSLTAIAFYTNTLMPAISASLANLSNITDPNFQLSLPGTVTGGGAYSFQDVTADYGDVQMLRAMLSAAQFFGYSLSANNANADMSWIETNIQAKTITLQALLNQFPSLGSKQNTGALAPSEQAAISAINTYFGAADFILNDRTDTNAIFNLSSNDIPKEVEFQTILTNLLASMTSPTQLNPNKVETMLNLAPYFAGNVSLRSLVPKFNGDSYVPDSVPDFTFGGLLPDLPPFETESGLLSQFPNYVGIYTGLLYDLPASAEGSFAAYISTNGQVIVVGQDPGDYYPDGSSFGVLVQGTLGKHGDWQASTSAFNAFGSVSKDGSFSGEIDYTNGQTVYLGEVLEPPGQLTPPTGPFQNSAGYYTGSFTGSPGDSLYSIVAADGELFFAAGKSGPGGNGGGATSFYFSDNDFSTNQPNGTEIYGILNTNSTAVKGTNYLFDPNSGSNYLYSVDTVNPGNITGIYSNYLNAAHGTFTMSRSSQLFLEYPPTITTDLPPVVAVQLGNTTTFQLGVSGTAPFTYQWFFNGTIIPGATSNTLVVGNNLWTSNGTYQISATIANIAGETNSMISDVEVESVVPPISSYAGIYIGTNGQILDNNLDTYGAFAVYISTNGQVTVLGEDDGDGNPTNQNNFGFLFQTTLAGGGYFNYGNSYLNAYGSISGGQISIQLNYPQADSGSVSNVYLTGYLQPRQGPFQNTDGLYTGTYSGSESGTVGVIFDANGDFFFTPVSYNSGGSPYGNAQTGAEGQFTNSTGFSITSIDGTVVAGALNPNTFVINGTYTNSGNSIGGTFIVSRSSKLIIPVAPAITTDLPSNLTIPVGNKATFTIGATGSQPLGYQWYVFAPTAFSWTPIPGATNTTLVASNNVFTTTGIYGIYANVYNDGGSTNSKTCSVNVVTETNIPTIAITAPGSGEIWSNSTFTITGTASDPAGVTGVVCVVNGNQVPVSPNPTYTNWTALVELSAGSNTISAYSINAGPIQSKTATVLMDYLQTNQMTVQISGVGSASPNYNNAWLFDGRNYSMTAAAGTGLALANWSMGTVGGALTPYTNSPTVQFAMSPNLELQANFTDANKPYLKITNAISGMTWGSGTFTVMGVATDDEEVASVNYSFNQSPYTNIASLNGIHWSSAPLTLMAGTNFFSAFDIATNGNISSTSTVAIVYLATNYLTIQISGKGTVSPNYPWLADGHNYSMTANPGSGFLFSNWMGGIYPNPLVVLTNKPTLTFMMQTNLVVQANFLDTLKPYLKVTNPVTATAFATNLTAYTFMGVATDDEQIATVNYSFNGSDYTPVSPAGIQWSSAALPLVAGTNKFSVYAQATNGNYSATSAVSMVMISPNPLTLQISGKGTISPNYSNALLNAGLNYSMAATAASGFKFINWTAETNPVIPPGVISPAIPVPAQSFSLHSTNSKVTFMMETGLVMQANFKDLNPPYLRITNIASQLITNAGSFTVMGVATDDEQMSFVTYSLNGSPANPVGSANGWTNWSEQLTLTAGTNLFTVYATATNGNVATNTAKIVSISPNPLTLQISGKGTFSPNYSNALLDAGVNYKMAASAGSGFKFINWTATTNGIGTFTPFGTNAALTFMMETGLVIQANFADTLKPYLSITNPLAKLLTTNVSTYTVMGVATDDQEVATVNYTFNGAASSLPEYTNKAAWNVPIALMEGTNTFSAWAVATNGNISTTNSLTIIRWPTVTIFPIATNDVAYPLAQLGFDGSNYLAVYLAAPYPYVNANPAGQFVSTNGVLEGSPLPLNPNSKDSPPCVDFDGINYLVAWAEDLHTNGTPIRGVFVSAATQQPAGNVLTLSQSTTAGDIGSIVYGRGHYFIMWPDDRTVPSSIYGALIDTSGTNVSGDFSLSANGTEGEYAGPQAAYDGTHFLAVWTSATGNMTISGQFIDGSGPVGSPFVIYTNSGPTGITAPSVIFNGENYLVLFNIGITNSNASAFHILGRFVTTDGTVLTNQVTMTADAGPQIVPGGDFDGVNFLASWNQGWNPYSLSATGVINGRFFDAIGKPTSAEFPIFTTGAGLGSLPAALAPPVIKLGSGYTATYAPTYFDGSRFVIVGGLGKLTPQEFTNNVIYGAFVSP